MKKKKIVAGKKPAPSRRKLRKPFMGFAVYLNGEKECASLIESAAESHKRALARAKAMADVAKRR